MIGNVWYFSLSMAYAIRSGAEITLHTDTLGAALLGHLPYTEIRLTLDDMPPGLHPRFWAAGKMWALAAEPAGSVHIDGDVFIKRPALAEDIAASEWDFIAQHWESSEWYEKENVLFDAAPKICASLGIDVHRIGAYNTGVLGFRDESMRDEYLSAYRSAALALSTRCRDILDQGHSLTPDVIIEQRHSFQICERHNARVKLILPCESGHGKLAAEIGYQHVLTSRKFELLDRCRDTLRRHFPYIYEKTYKLCQNI